VLHSAIGPVQDSIPITGTLDVQTSGTGVWLTSDYGSEILSGMGAGGGDFLMYYNKPSVTLETYAPNAGIFLASADAAAGESNFTVNMHGAGDTTFLDAADPAPSVSYLTVNMQAAGQTTTLDQTPKNVLTVVNVDQPATNASVALWGNFGPVIIDGDSTTAVTIGYPLSSTGTITSGIEANVTVEGAASLVVNDTGSFLPTGAVTLTPSTISGHGLFSNDGVTVNYGGVTRTLVTWNSTSGIQFVSENWIRPLQSARAAAVKVAPTRQVKLALEHLDLQLAPKLGLHPASNATVDVLAAPGELVDR
jgi:hypothetical protein